ncbi:CinA family protein [Roseomonas hellenica]|uniref:CinA family protein n=1 Tax=Plastoroseomonas hellenica TaxID=2687306 RepID=A0ABS5F8U1_9PROT|nr:nicotinamide-nucleotide amidohydrolase family protein [Plastoroseomonas hellenica]MBR0668550.1 CinA family protein [Plastoroseomonas hellenica]
MIDDATLGRAAALLATLQAKGLTVTTAESCSGGLIAGTITAIPGSSASIEAGFVTYSNAAKHRILGVPESLLAAHGAVSEPVARAMAEGARAAAGADLALACTGIAGPGGAVPGKPVGTVFIAAAVQGQTRVLHRLFPGDRAAVRAATVAEALELGLALVTVS